MPENKTESPTTSRTIIALTNPKSSSNVGGAMRAAGCYDAQKVVYSGDRFNRAVRLAADTQKVHEIVPLVHYEELLDALEPGMKLICVDLIEGAIPLPNFVHPKNAMYLFGPEDGTIKQKVINKADAVVYVPTIGCMNLAASVNVVMYDKLAKSQQHQLDNELIKKSRDRNNKIKVKALKYEKNRIKEDKRVIRQAALEKES
ncbi:RNA methyltransferase [Psychromonas sp. 14N.309.X.WAT.B.A12]|uniref:RNA methyltransferase n=1 Tax=Psychromonas sp. 14N.309.X.WAT.B.A12 TaxID=2998322 RepID=UPI0025B00E77|nr:RNA methyltransferase [Psychromonas sp. 14N.309.X.WAT.B.A12]MDN2662039.1 RNA methyltransferase [Psychromonas sp. 14N.309.X.WAT.B.A12]